jgi:hypothetical protein
MPAGKGPLFTETDFAVMREERDRGVKGWAERASLRLGRSAASIRVKASIIGLFDDDAKPAKETATT